jgi:hypothetical protein
LKKFVSILLVFLMIIPASGIYYLYVLQKAQIERNFKTKLKAGIPETQWVLFKFADKNEAKKSSELQWVKSYEFVYRGEFYDIVKETTVNDSLYLLCIHDFKDTQLAARKKKAFSSPPEDRTKYAPAYKIVLNWFYQIVKLIKPHPGWLKEKYHFFYSRNFQKISLRPETPPPQMAVIFNKNPILTDFMVKAISV